MGNCTAITCYRPVKTPHFIGVFIDFDNGASFEFLCGMQKG